MLLYTHVESPVGRLKVVASNSHLLAVLWPDDRVLRVRMGDMREGRHPVLVETERQLTQYFRGERRTFELPIHLQGTPFQDRVWRQLLHIPYGHTLSYGQLAVALGNGKAARAVGMAAGKNPLSIIIPCHRVVGASGALTGFAGGLRTKARLLELEAAANPALGAPLAAPQH